MVLLTLATARTRRTRRSTFEGSRGDGYKRAKEIRIVSGRARGVRVGVVCVCVIRAHDACMIGVWRVMRIMHGGVYDDIYVG